MRFATPMLTNDDGSAKPLRRLDLAAKGEDGYDEQWLQRLISDHPTLLPIDEIETAFTPAISVCTELPLASGFLDNLLVTPLGNLIAVECKLWRNPEARRKVVAQVIDYAKDLQRMTYDDLQKAIGTARKNTNFHLYNHVCASAASAIGEEAEPELDEPRFVDAVSRNLSRGRSLLLIAGDGVAANAEAMTEFLQQHAGLHFAIAVVQLAVYQVEGSAQRVIVPSIPMRTTNIVRGIVEVSDGKVAVLPPPITPNGQKATTLTEDEFMLGLDALRAGTSAQLKQFLVSLEDLGVEYEVKKTLVVRMAVADMRPIVFVVKPDGVVETGYTFNKKTLFRPCYEELAAALPGAILKETPASWYVASKKSDGSRLTIWDYFDHADGVRAALATLNSSMIALEAKAGDAS